jgi:diguanylate cyclase (GGDEF)-like protein
MPAKDQNPAASPARRRGARGPQPTNGKAQRAAPDAPAILASIGEVAYEWDLSSDTLRWGENVSDVLGVTADAVASGRAFAAFLSGDNVQTRFDAVTRSPQADAGRGVAYEIQYALNTPDGRIRWVEDIGRWFAGADGRRPVRAHGVVRVVTERHEQESQLLYLSKFDKLTGEANREHFTEILAGALDEAGRFRTSCGLLLIAIDHLDRVNEAYGFEIADELIAAVAGRLRSKLRGGDVIGRFSGNKFAVLLRNCALDDILVAAERLSAGVRDDILVTSSGTVAVTVTIGGVVVPRHANEAVEAIARARETLNSARVKRVGSILIYRPSVEREAIRAENVRATDEIVAALNERRIELAFEPIVATASRQPAFYESLIRFARADGTQVGMGAIIPVAERLGLVRLLDHRVIELVTAELKASPTLNLSLNVSPTSTRDPGWWTSLGTHLRTRPDIARRLTVEITEMAEIRDIDETRGFVSRIKDFGCRIAIDDFGAGFTSFRNLRMLGVDIIKIDGAFVQNITRSEDDRVFVRTLVELGQNLGLKTVAEWVQDEEAAAMLQQWGCDYLQGALTGLASTQRPWRAPPEASSHSGAA